MDDTYKNIEEYNPNKKRKVVIVFDDMIPDIISNEKLNPIGTLSLDNPLHFRKNLSERIQKFIMTIDGKVRDEKQQYDINREAAKTSVLSSRKIDNMHI